MIFVEFRAGKLHLSGGTLRADTRKGLLRISKCEDGLLHFRWYERSGTEARPEPEDDIVLMPKECTFSKIDRPNSRVYKLEFEEADRNAFFWMQEPSADKDEEHCELVNQCLLGGFEDEDTVNEDSEMADIVQQDGGDDEGPETSSHLATSAGAQQQLAPRSQAAAAHAGNLARILSSLAGPATPATPERPSPAQAAALLSALAGGQGTQRKAAGPSLSELLKPEVVLPLLDVPDMVEQLAPHLPPEHRSPAALKETAQSPQFRQQLDVFSAALQSGQLDLSQFGLTTEGYAVADFLESIQRSVEKEQQPDEQ